MLRSSCASPKTTRPHFLPNNYASLLSMTLYVVIINAVLPYSVWRNTTQNRVSGQVMIQPVKHPARHDTGDTQEDVNAISFDDTAGFKVFGPNKLAHLIVGTCGVSQKNVDVPPPSVF